MFDIIIDVVHEVIVVEGSEFSVEADIVVVVITICGYDGEEYCIFGEYGEACEWEGIEKVGEFICDSLDILGDLKSPCGHVYFIIEGV